MCTIVVLQILLYHVLEKLLHNINNFHKTRNVSKILLTLTFFQQHVLPNC